VMTYSTALVASNALLRRWTERLMGQIEARLRG
jgi:hypothetical protein